MSVPGPATEAPRAPFVRTDDGLVRAAIVAAPSAAIDRAVPIHGEPHAIPERAREQHEIFVGRLRSYGITVARAATDPAAPSRPGASDAESTIVQDAAVVFAAGAFLMRPAEPARRDEIDAVAAALERAGVPIVGRIAAPGLLDGGDVLVSGDTLFVARSQRRAAQVGVASFVHGNDLGREQLAAYARGTGLQVVEVDVASTVRRLRSVATAVADDTILLAPGLLDATVFGGRRLIVAPPGEEYGAGVLSLGGRRVIANLRFRTLIPLLRKAKIAVDAIDLWEFGKIGATPSSLVLVFKRG